jgi:hypothetical protein
MGSPATLPRAAGRASCARGGGGDKHLGQKLSHITASQHSGLFNSVLHKKAPAQIRWQAGAYLCAGTAAFDHRPAAIVLDDGVTSFFATYPPLPEFLVEWTKAGRDEQAIPLLEWIKNTIPARWALQTGRGHMAPRMREYIRKSEQFALTTEHMHTIKSPALILERENDFVFKGQAAKLASDRCGPRSPFRL